VIKYDVLGYRKERQSPNASGGNYQGDVDRFPFLDDSSDPPELPTKNDSLVSPTDMDHIESSILSSSFDEECLRALEQACGGAGAF